MNLHRSGLYCAFFALVLTGCTSDHLAELPVQQTVCPQNIIEDAAYYNAASFVSANIQEAKINNNCFTVKFSASGCDGNSWIPKLVTDGIIDHTTSPATRHVKFVLENSEVCLAVFQKEKLFGLQTMQINGQNSVQIKLVNTGQNFVYQY